MVRSPVSNGRWTTLEKPGVEGMIDTDSLRCYSTVMFGYPCKHVRFAAAGQTLSLVGDVA